MKKMLLTGIALGLGVAFASAANAQIKIGVAGPITGPNAAATYCQTGRQVMATARPVIQAAQPPMHTVTRAKSQIDCSS